MKPWLGAFAALFLVLSSCTDPVDVPSPSTAASDFAADWKGRRAAEMLEAFDETSATDWTDKSLQKWLDKTMKAGNVQSFDVETSPITTPEVESEEELDGLEVSVPYTLSYTSSIADEPVEFEGDLAMTYEDPEG